MRSLATSRAETLGDEELDHVEAVDSLMDERQ